MGAWRAEDPQPYRLSRTRETLKRRVDVVTVATASSNPRSVDRIFKELRRTNEAPEMLLSSARSTGLSTARSRKDEEEEERQVEAIEAGLRALDEDSRAGRIGKGSKLVLDVCYCVDLGQRSLAVRQKPERFVCLRLWCVCVRLCALLHVSVCCPAASWMCVCVCVCVRARACTCAGESGARVTCVAGGAAKRRRVHVRHEHTHALAHALTRMGVWCL